MTAVKAIMEGTDPRCHTSSCRDGRCTLSLENAPKPMALINLEHEAAPVDPDAPRSDFLYISKHYDTGQVDSMRFAAQ